MSRNLNGMTDRQAVAFELHHRGRYMETLKREERERKQPASPREKRQRAVDAFWREQERLLEITDTDAQDAVDRASTDEIEELLGAQEGAEVDELLRFWNGRLDDVRR
jgi:hypothetical protein